MIDFTNCKQYKKSYNGANGNKICIDYNNERYMLKFPSKPTKITELSYANGCISEYLCCHIYDMLNIPVQKTLLGTYFINNKEKIVVACKDFTDIGIILQDFGSLKNQVIDSEHQGYGTELQSILDAILTQQSIDPKIVIERFWDMFIVDALLGNFDRHNGNWGFLYNQNTDELYLAPVYDCGSCLFPQADKKTILSILLNQNELNARIYNYPTSAIKINNKKINYRDFLLNTDNIDCKKSLLKIFPSININQFNQFIDTIECLEDIQKIFYKTMLKERYEKILEPAYSKLLKQEQNIVHNLNQNDLEYDSDFDDI